jgi:hypothetical protein
VAHRQERQVRLVDKDSWDRLPKSFEADHDCNGAMVADPIAGRWFWAARVLASGRQVA